jgi:hypothetical protein
MNRITKNISNLCRAPQSDDSSDVGLREALQRILHYMGDDPLVRLLIDLEEAGQLESFEQRNGEKPTTFWRVVLGNNFATRFLAIENEIQSALAEGVLTQFVIFSITPGPPIDILWQLAESPPVN